MAMRVYFLFNSLIQATYKFHGGYTVWCFAGDLTDSGWAPSYIRRYSLDRRGRPAEERSRIDRPLMKVPSVSRLDDQSPRDHRPVTISISERPKPIDFQISFGREHINELLRVLSAQPNSHALDLTAQRKCANICGYFRKKNSHAFGNHTPQLDQSCNSS